MSYNDAENYFKRVKIFLRKKLGIPPSPQKDHSERRSNFAALPPERKMAIVQPQMDLFIAAVTRKFEILPVIATLAATLIIVATLNPVLVPLTVTETKLILSLFLLLIPVTIHFYIWNNEKTALNALGVIESYQSEGLFDELGRATLTGQVATDFPKIITYIFYGVSVLIVFRIWFG
jgi:hypothetical protein